MVGIDDILLLSTPLTGVSRLPYFVSPIPCLALGLPPPSHLLLPLVDIYSCLLFISKCCRLSPLP